MYLNSNNGVQVTRQITGNIGLTPEEGNIDSIFSKTGGMYKSAAYYSTNGFPSSLDTHLYYNYNIRQVFSIYPPAMRIKTLKTVIQGSIIRQIGSKVESIDLSDTVLKLTVSMKQNGVTKVVEETGARILRNAPDRYNISNADVVKEIDVNGIIDCLYLNFECTGKSYRRHDKHEYDVDISLFAIINQICFWSIDGSEILVKGFDDNVYQLAQDDDEESPLHYCGKDKKIHNLVCCPVSSEYASPLRVNIGNDILAAMYFKKLT